MRLERLLAVARGDEPAELVLRNLRLVNVLSGEVHPADLAVTGGRVASLTPGCSGEVEVDLRGRFVCPGFVDPHVHIESALVPPGEFARAVLPCGVTTVVADPHEIANVCGLEGVLFMLREAERAPLEVFLTAPACVPASPLDTSGARLDAADLVRLLGEPHLLGLGEVMDFRGLVRGEPELLAKLRAFAGRSLDGHCPGLAGAALDAYAASGISSDHESVAADEARDKLRRGLFVYLRQASHARNLRALLPLVSPTSERRLAFCTDDRHPGHLGRQGSIDDLVRTAIASGVDPIVAIRMATLNPAEHYRLDDRGAVAPGRRADLVAFENLAEPRPDQVWVGGRLVAAGGEPRFDLGPRRMEPPARSVRIDWSRVDFAIPAEGPTVRVIGLVPEQILTRSLVEAARLVDGQAVADPERDLLKLAVVERHHRTGRVGLGFVRGLGLRHGALASTVAHDHHNLVAVGADDVSMHTAARAVAAAGGGMAVADGDRLLGLVELPIAGLMSERPFERVRDQIDELHAAARRLGAVPDNPFMAMIFVALEVVPALKLTDLGLIDVERSARVGLFVEG